MRNLPPLLVFILVAAIGGFITAAVRSSEMAENNLRFDTVADDAAERIHERVQQHIALLVATSAYLNGAGDDVTRDAFFQFISQLELERRFDGVQGIGYARILSPGDEKAVEARIARDYAISRGVWPDSNNDVKTAITLLEPSDERNRAALGYDMYTEESRRRAIRRTMQSGETSATAPVTLVQEITADKQAGFLVYYPLKDRGEQHIKGLVYAPFRAGDLHEAVLRSRFLPIEIRTRDKDADESGLLYISDGFDETKAGSAYSVDREIAIAGRTWIISMQPTQPFLDTTGTPFALITGLTALLLAIAIAAATRWQLQTVQRTRELFLLQEKTLQEKDLMLQEMKHRIKNSIARILAIARQTVSSSETISDFSESFTSRLQSMANAQDMLTRSHWEGANLRDLITSELNQVYGPSIDESHIKGPDVLLSGVQTQALGITLHELATNSMKYGAGSHTDGELAVDWRVEKIRGGDELVLTWSEKATDRVEEPEIRGFGTRLIDASIRGELGGRIDRHFNAAGLTVIIRVPNVGRAK